MRSCKPEAQTGEREAGTGQRLEPDDFLNLAERMNSWALMVALIGEDQEIHPGEESGLAQWNDFVIGDA